MTSRLAPSAPQVHPPAASEVTAMPVVTVGADDPVIEVWRLMQSAHLGHVAVVDDGDHRGIVTTADVLRAVADREDPSC